MIRIIEHEYTFKGGKTLKYLENIETKTITGPDGKKKTVTNSTFRIMDPATNVSTPEFPGDKDGSRVLPKDYNENYMVYFMKGSNILYKIKPCENGSEELYQQYEFTGKKIKGIRQQGKFDVFIITLYDSNGEVEMIFDMKSFKPVSERTFNSLEYGDCLKENQRDFRIEKSVENGLETTVGVVNILTGEIESSEVLEEPTFIPSVVSVQKDGKTRQCIYDLLSKKAISDCFEFIGEGVKDHEMGQKYNNNSHFFMDSITVGNKNVPFVGIVNGFGQIAPVIFNAVSQELVKIPLIRENGIDFIDREKLQEVLSNEKRSINDSSIATTLRRINRNFLMNGSSKRDLQGYDISITKEPTPNDKIDLIKPAVIVGDSSLVYLCQRHNGNIINAQLDTIKYTIDLENDGPHYCREIFGPAVKSSERMGFVKKRPGYPLNPFVKEFNVGGLKIVFSGEVRNDGLIAHCDVTITDEIKQSLNRKYELPIGILPMLAELNLSTINDYVNVRLFNPTIAEDLGKRMIKEREGKKTN